MLRDQENSIPIYKQLRQLILDQIGQGKLVPGEKISTENSLADQFQVSRTTIRRSLKGLENEGLIVRFPGKGTFISEGLDKSQNPHYTIGINFFSNYASNHFYGQIVDGIMAKANQWNIHIRVLPRDLKDDEGDDLDGLIFTGKPDPETPLYRKAAKGILPAAGFNSRIGRHTAFIGIDNREETRKGVNLLIGKGCRKIGFYGSRPTGKNNAAADRFQGYCDALKKNGLKVDLGRVHFFDHSEDRCLQALEFFRTSDMDSLFVSLAPVFQGVLYAMNIMRIAISDFPLLCFDNLELLQMNWPGISYIRMPLRTIGEHLILSVRQSLILKERAPVVNEIFSAEIITGE